MARGPRERGIQVRALARADIADQAAWLAHSDVEVAVRFIDAIDSTLTRLRDRPALGRARAFESPHLAGVRSLRVDGFLEHLVFYRWNDDLIDVLRVLHGARDLGAALLGDEE